MLFQALVCSGVLVWMVRHVCGIKEPAELMASLASLPVIIAAMAGLLVAPYGVRRPSSSLADIAGMRAKR